MANWRTAKRKAQRRRQRERLLRPRHTGTFSIDLLNAALQTSYFPQIRQLLDSPTPFLRYLEGPTIGTTVTIARPVARPVESPGPVARAA